MKTIQKELFAFFSTLITCYIAHKLSSYNVFIIYYLIRIWVELKEGKNGRL